MQDKVRLSDVSLRASVGPSKAPRSPFDTAPSSAYAYTGRDPGELGAWARRVMRSGGLKLSDVSLRKPTQPATSSFGLPPTFVSPLEPPRLAEPLVMRGGIRLPDVSLRPARPF